jgi:hypothetical protein
MDAAVFVVAISSIRAPLRSAGPPPQTFYFTVSKQF